MRFLSVEEVTTRIKDVLESDDLLSDAWVRGEVSNVSRSAAGHVYFTVKDACGQLRCVLFRHHARYQSYLPVNGDLVVIHGHISLYPASGALQLYADLVHTDGVGEIFLEFERLRQRLAEEGLFDEGRKRPLPAYPRCVGVVTSAQGAVWHDITTIIGRRYPAVQLILAPAQVQGDGAATTLVTALRQLWECGRCDVIIVARGGGSAEDLGVFNDEALARAIFASPVPVISAIGHEVDYTIADLVADLRAPTPSAAAELVVPDGANLLRVVAASQERLRLLVRGRLDAERMAVAHGARHLGRVSPAIKTKRCRQRIADQMWVVGQALRHRQALERQRVGACQGQLQALDPVAVLARGYALVTRVEDGVVVTRAGAAPPGTRLDVWLADGRLGARVAERDRERTS